MDLKNYLNFVVKGIEANHFNFGILVDNLHEVDAVLGPIRELIGHENVIRHKNPYVVTISKVPHRVYLYGEIMGIAGVRIDSLIRASRKYDPEYEHLLLTRLNRNSIIYLT